MVANMLVQYVISVVVFYIIIVNYKKADIITRNRLIFFILALVLVCVEIIIKSIFGYKNIIYTIIIGIIKPVNISIFIYLILNRKDK